MKKMSFNIISVILAISILFSGFSFNCSADATSVLTADFDIDPELWKALTEANTFNYDDNNDGLVTKEEFADCYGMQIDCQGYDIQDWSGLKYGTKWKYIAIKNCNGGDFSVLNEMPALYEFCLMDCKDFSNITGLTAIDDLTKITINSDTIVDINALKANPDLIELSISAPEITGYEAISEIEHLDVLSLSADSSNGIENYPDKMIIDKLSVSFKDFNDTKMSALIDKHIRINDLTVNDSNITSFEWIHDLKYLYYLDIRNNQCRDISTLLEHKNLQTMTLFLDKNPWAPDTEDILAKALLKMENEYTISTGDYIYLDSIHHDWSCDIVGELEFTIDNPSIAYIRDGYSHLTATSPGETILRVSNGKDVDLEYKVTAIGSPIITDTPEPINPEPPIWVGITVGDVNSDDNINAEDALLVLKHAAKITTLDEGAAWCADADVSFSVDATDALYILQYAAALISSFDDLAINTYPPVEPCPTETVEATKRPTDYDNSFEVTIETKEKKTFTTEDFPSVELTKVLTASMVKTEAGYSYTLLLYLDDATCTDEILESAMATVAEYENVSHVDYNGYCYHDSIIDLNYDVYELKVGESISLYIDDYRPHNASTHMCFVLIELNQNTINGSEFNLEALAPYGIDSYIKISDIPYSCYPAVNNDFNEDMSYALMVDKSYVEVTNSLSQLPETDAVVIGLETYPTGNRYTEYWEISDDSIASMTLSGGKPMNESSSTTRIDQTATITALTPGEVTISVTKQGWGNQDGAGICKIKIVE